MAKKETDLLKHFLIPKHHVLSAEEKKELLEKYDISEIQLPSIKKTDPVVQLLKAKVDDVIKITRDTKFEQRAVYFRRVI